MNVTRLKQGYRIRLSDSEMEALEMLVGMGLMETEKYDPKELQVSPSAKRVLNSPRWQDIALMSIDEDRR